jgi:hypothetical protein
MCNVVVGKRARTIADEMAQMVDADKAVGVPALQVTRALLPAPTANSTKPGSLKADSQVCTIIVSTNLEQISSNYFFPR